MKLPNVSHGPVTLKNINYAPNLSEETAAFTAVIEINGKSSVVKNDGRGGSNHIVDMRIHGAVHEYAKGLPPYVGPEIPTPLAYTADFLVSMMVQDAIQANNHKKYARKGYTHSAKYRGVEIYSVGEPSQDVLARYFKENASKAQVTKIVN